VYDYVPLQQSLCLYTVPIKPIFFSANQRFCWAHADAFLTLTLLSMQKPPIFWAHADISKSEWEHCVYTNPSLYALLAFDSCKTIVGSFVTLQSHSKYKETAAVTRKASGMTISSLEQVKSTCIRIEILNLKSTQMCN